MLIGTAAFWVSVFAVTFWAYWDFHYPYHPKIIKYSVTRQRYILSVAVYMAAAISMFFIMFNILRILHRQILSHLYAGSPAIGVPLLAALVATVLLPKVPGVRNILLRVRIMVQHLALFPGASQRLASLLARKTCSIEGDFFAATLKREIARYGLPEDATQRYLLPGAAARLHEAHSLHERFGMAQQEKVLRQFVDARGEEIEVAVQEHRRLLRRAARVMVLARTIIEDTSEATPNIVSDGTLPKMEALSSFVADESITLTVRYRRLIADAALSCFIDRRHRTAYIEKYFGCVLSSERDLSFWAIVSVICVFPTTFFIFLLPSILRQIGFTPVASMPHIPFATAATIGAVFATQQVITVLWAVVPKILTPYARPSLRSLPVMVYVFVGLGAYISNLLIRLLLVIGTDNSWAPSLGVNIIELSLVTGIFSLVIAVGAGKRKSLGKTR